LDAFGPLAKKCTATGGIIIRHGYIVAEWATQRIDPVYSVAKSFLSTLTGLAIQRGLATCTIREAVCKR
jgi:hypothetical protein